MKNSISHIAFVLFLAGIILMTGEGSRTSDTILIRICGIALVASASIIWRVDAADEDEK